MSTDRISFFRLIQATRSTFNITYVTKPEARLLFWSWRYISVLFISNSILRPIRDELGVAGGVKNLSWLFIGTLLAMLLVNPLFAWLHSGAIYQADVSLLFTPSADISCCT